MRRAVLFISVLLLFLALLPGPAGAGVEAGIAVLESYVEADFPSLLTFNLVVEGEAGIDRVELFYEVDRISHLRVVNRHIWEFDSQGTVEKSWSWDMRKATLPPGAELAYWWVVEDAAGHRLTTDPTPVVFEDGGHPWRSLGGGEVTVYWYDGSQSFAEELLDSALDALDLLEEDIGAFLEEPVKIYIYASQQALLGALIFPQEWTGGLNFVYDGIIALGVSPGDLEWGRLVVAHELTHSVVYQVTLNPYCDLPTWLHEGLATYMEAGGELRWDLFITLERAIAEERLILAGEEGGDGEGLISVKSLASSFPTDPTEARLSYAQSFSLVEFLIDGFGRERMLQLLDVFQEGSRADDALFEVYGFDTDGLERAWRHDLGLAAGVGAP